MIGLLTALCLASAAQGLAGASPCQSTPGVMPLRAAHAHNDYLHPRPILDALEHGFCSVEADVFRVGDDLLVAHERKTLKPERTFRALYLDPLRERVRLNRGRVYPKGPPFTLLVDIKEDGLRVYELLRMVLSEYRDMLTEVRDGKALTRAVTVVLSGDCPRDAVLADRIRHCAVDGRLGDLDSTLPAHAMPIISDRWFGNFRWFGIGPMPEPDREKLAEIVRKAHSAGRRVRFWAAPDRENVWEELLAAGVDMLNVDDLGRLRTFLTARERRLGLP